MIRFENNLGIHLFKAYFSIYKYLRKVFTEHHIENMNPTRLGILLALADEDGLIMSRLGQKLFLEKSTMTGVIDKMEADGLVQRKSDENDRRALRIYLTPAAKRLNEVIFKIIDEAYGNLSVDLTAEEIATAVKVTQRVGQAAHDQVPGNEKKP
jgi:MarR family transcriptional regulator, organic hydroperoxide resistance regulator